MFLPDPPATPDWQQPQMFYGKPLLFNPNTHKYTWDGKHVVSVTTILKRLAKPELIDWAANCAVDHIAAAFVRDGFIVKATDDDICALLTDARTAHTRIRDKAGDVGTKLHEAVRALLSGDHVRLPLDDQVAKALQAFSEWRLQHRIQPLALERRVFSADMMYAGTTDFWGYIDDELCVLDFKTGGSDIYDETWYQLAGYEAALLEELPTSDRPAHWAVHLNKNTGQCKAYRRGPNETAAARSAWSCLVALDKAIRAMPKMERSA